MRGFDVAMAANGAEALEVDPPKKFDLALLDLRMPESTAVNCSKCSSKITVSGSYHPHRARLDRFRRRLHRPGRFRLPPNRTISKISWEFSVGPTRTVSPEISNLTLLDSEDRRDAARRVQEPCASCANSTAIRGIGGRRAIYPVRATALQKSQSPSIQAGLGSRRFSRAI